ncbi:MAG: REP-associated tyrosine transposase [Terriglobales bacterium]
MNRVYEYRRHLPHYQGDNKAIFLTFSTHHRWILPPDARSLVLECCTWGNGTRLNLHGAVVMPDHVHLIFTPLYDGDSLHSVAGIMQAIKGTSAHRINRLLNRSGQVWQRESFDRALRHEESIHAKVEYLVQNPVRAGLVRTAEEYRWLWVPDLANVRDVG